MDNLIRPQALAKKLGIGLSTLYDLINNDPTFPKRIHLSSNVRAFRESEVNAWIDQKTEKKQETAAA